MSAPIGSAPAPRYIENPVITTLNRVAAAALIISLIATTVLVPWVASAAGATLTSYAIAVFTVSTATTLLSATVALVMGLYQKYKAEPPVVVIPVAAPAPLPVAPPAAEPVVVVPVSEPPSPPPSSGSSPLPSSSPAPEESSSLADTFNEFFTALKIAVNGMRVVPKEAPGIGVGQSLELRVAPSDPDEEEVSADVDSEEVLSFPELFGRATASFHTFREIISHRLFGVPETPERAIRVKASKYEALMNTINQSLNEAGLPLVHLSERPSVYTLDYLDALRNRYTETLTMLRNVDNPHYHRVCSDLYTQTDLSEENTNLLSLLGVRPLEGDRGIWDYLHQVSAILNRAPAELTTSPINRIMKSVKDYRGLYFSPLNAGNPPQDLVHLNLGDFPIKVLGMGSPTCQGINLYAEATIDPIFEKHLLHLRAIGQKHFYVSNQNHKDEQVRNRVIMRLQEKYPDVLVAITCAKNTSFYKGHGPSEINLFEIELYNQFFVYPVEKSGCYLPERLRNSRAFQDWAKQAISAISATFFADKTNFTEEEKKFINELFYNVLTLKIMFEEHISYINFTCKDGIDRGMGSLGWFLFLILKNAKLEKSSNAINLFLQVFFTRAFWTRKRNIIEERFERVAEDMHTLDRLDPDGAKTHGLLSHLAPWLANLHVEL